MQHNITDSAPAPEARIVPATPSTIARAGAMIREGRLVAFPTETVYGLGADATQGRAVASIYAAKGRPSFNPLIAHIPGIGEADRYGVVDHRAEELATHFWPGPLTLILPRRVESPISELVTAGLDSVALRAPAHPVARALLAAADRPIAAPSANRSGHVSATAAIHVAEEFGDEVAMILAGGRSEVGLESTILDLTGDDPVLLRPGAISAEMIEQVVGPVRIGAGDPDRPNAPGQLLRHYAPRTPLRLNAQTVEPGEALLAFGPPPMAARRAETMMNLSEAGDLDEAAANLFAMMRALDATRCCGIAVMPIPTTGLGIAINDRLARAAAPAEDSV